MIRHLDLLFWDWGIFHNFFFISSSYKYLEIMRNISFVYKP